MKQGAPTEFKILIDDAEGAFIIQFEQPYEWVGLTTEGARVLRDALNEFLEKVN